MHDQIGITANRTGEMQVVRLGQSIVTKWLRKVARTFQTFQQTDFERLLFRFATDRGKQALYLTAMRQIADLVVKTKHELAILRQFFWIRIFVNAIDCGNGAVLQLARHGLVRGQHEFFDQLMRFIILDALKAHWLASFIQPYFYVRKIEIERAMLESLSPQQRGKFPGDV